MVILMAALMGLAGQSATEATPVAPPAKPKKICRTIESNNGISTGTNMGPAHICKTQEEWAKADAKKAKRG